jgi:hypothetical protein
MTRFADGQQFGFVHRPRADEVRNIPLNIEQAEDWELVLADPDEQRRLREAGYCFD